MGDFLRKNASTPLREHFLAARVPCRLSTNSASILAAARESFSAADTKAQRPEFSMRFWTDSNKHSTGPWPKPYLRGLDRLVYAGFDEGSFALVDLRSHRIVGRVSATMADDIAYWKRVIFPMLISVIGATVGVTELHCACVAKDNGGILLAGQSHSGKSTLALALGSLGFDFLSDDRTCCSMRNRALHAWSLPTDLKLRAEAAKWFSALPPSVAILQGHELRFPPETLPSINRVRDCIPRCLLFLNPQAAAGFQLNRISPQEAAARLENDLLAESPEAKLRQDAVISRITNLPCYVVQYNQEPWSTAKKIAAWFEELPKTRVSQLGQTSAKLDRSKVAASEPESHAPLVNASRRNDPLGRFAGSAQRTTLSVMGRAVSFETNSENLAQRVEQLFSVYPRCAHRTPHFRWRIIQHPASWFGNGGFTRSAFSDSNLRFAQVGQRSFYALDLESRTAVGSITEEVMKDELRFVISFMDSLFCMTASSLGLVSLHANCVARDGRGIIILGEPGSGKTTMSYLAAQRGMDFHSDEGVFLEICQGDLRAWGGFWPVVFRQHTVDIFPELQSCTGQFTYGDLSFCPANKGCLQSRDAEPVLPACSIFLSRSPSQSVTLAQLSPLEVYERLASSLLFEEQEQFAKQQDTALRILSSLPTYELSYGRDPAAAVELIEDLLSRAPSMANDCASAIPELKLDGFEVGKDQ
jgi:hypothetical protein